VRVDCIADEPAGSATRAIHRRRDYRHLAGTLEREVAVERVSQAAGLIEARDADTCVLHVGGPTLADFPELVERVRLAERFGRAAGLSR
jgi:hypothetical protein